MEFYKDKIAYVTGGSSGIGLEIAKQLAAQGAHVAILARTQANLDNALKEVEAARISNSQKVKAISLDVTDHVAVNREMRQNAVDFGFPDLLVVNAGVGYADYLEKISYEIFDQVIQTNVYGARNVVYSILPEMKQRGGHIAFVASLSGFAGVPGYTAYGTSKYALVGMAECLRSEVKHHQIKITLVCPPEVDTPLVAEEAKTIPPETRVIKDMAGTLSVGQVAKATLKAIPSKKFLVIPGILAKTSYFLNSLLPGRMTRSTVDLIVNKYKRKV